MKFLPAAIEVLEEAATHTWFVDCTGAIREGLKGSCPICWVANQTNKMVVYYNFQVEEAGAFLNLPSRDVMDIIRASDNSNNPLRQELEAVLGLSLE